MFYISSAVVNISPVVSTFLGCGPRESVLPQTSSDLEANVLLVSNLNHKPIMIFISVDALYAGPRLRGDIEAEFGEELSGEKIFLSASHSHFAPMLDDTKPELGVVVEEHYLRVVRGIFDGIRHTLTDKKPLAVQFRHRRYRTHAPIYRRRVFPLVIRNSKLEFFRAQPLPQTFSRLRFYADVLTFSASGKIEACIWVMPCHPVDFPGPPQISSHYIGVVRKALRESESVNRKIPFIFIQGASGDLRPPSFGFRRVDSVKSLAVNLLFGPTFLGFFSKIQWLRWVGDLTDEFMRCIREPPETDNVYPPETGSSSKRRTLGLSAYFNYAYPRERVVSLQSVQLAGVSILGVSAEVSWRLRDELVRRTQDPNLIVAGCIDDSYGYLLSSRQARWGGYEVQGFLEPFSMARGPKKIEQHLPAEIYSFLKED